MDCEIHKFKSPQKCKGYFFIDPWNLDPKRINDFKVNQYRQLLSDLHNEACIWYFVNLQI